MGLFIIRVFKTKEKMNFNTVYCLSFVGVNAI